MQGTCRVRAGYVQGTCRVRAGYVQGTCRVHAGCMQGTCRVRAGCMQGTCRVRAGCMQGTCRVQDLRTCDLQDMVDREMIRDGSEGDETVRSMSVVIGGGSALFAFRHTSTTSTPACTEWSPWWRKKHTNTLTVSAACLTVSLGCAGERVYLLQGGVIHIGKLGVESAPCLCSLLMSVLTLLIRVRGPPCGSLLAADGDNRRQG